MVGLVGQVDGWLVGSEYGCLVGFDVGLVGAEEGLGIGGLDGRADGIRVGWLVG